MNPKIFKYNDGFSDVYGDPSEIDYQLDMLGVNEMLTAPRIAEIPTLEDGNIDFPNADKNDLKLLVSTYHEAEPMIRRAFGVLPFNKETGEGLLYEDVISLLNNYRSWQLDIKKNIESQQNSASPTG